LQEALQTSIFRDLTHIGTQHSYHLQKNAAGAAAAAFMPGQKRRLAPFYKLR
jgi:hypothetical protein